MTIPYAVTPAELRATAESVLDPQLAQRLLDRADEMEAGQKRDVLRAAYEREVMVHGLMSRRADVAFKALSAETHRQLGART